MLFAFSSSFFQKKIDETNIKQVKKLIKLNVIIDEVSYPK